MKTWHFLIFVFILYTVLLVFKEPNNQNIENNNFENIVRTPLVLKAKNVVDTYKKNRKGTTYSFDFNETKQCVLLEGSNSLEFTIDVSLL